MARYITATQARKIFFQLLDDADTPGAVITITLEGQPKAVMMSAEEFEGWMETLEILSDPKAVKGIEEGLRDMKMGRTRSFEEVEKKLRGEVKKKRGTKKRRTK